MKRNPAPADPRPESGTFNFFPCTNISDCKAITVNWCSSRTYLGVNSDDMPQTATVVMRN